MQMRTNKKNKLSAQYFLRIRKVFEDKHWEINDSQEEQESHFNRYCERISLIKENEKKDLILDLTDRYLWVKVDEYMKLLIDLFEKMLDSNPQIANCEKIYVTTLVSPRDKDKSKSAQMLVYQFNSSTLRYHKKISKIKIEILHDIKDLPDSFRYGNEFLLLADDYIGTGETAEKCIKYLIENNIEANRLIVFSLVAQEQGLNLLKKYNIYTTTSIVRKKGISDYYIGEDLDRNIRLMEDIENRLGIKSKYRFGYGKSESLVTMCRTPNNTFPIFWEENENMKIAPFPRY